jgi:DNA-binding NarL/FixJ family response regulator
MNPANLDLLIVDPQPVARAGLCTILGGLVRGGRIRESHTAAVAWSLIGEGRPQLIVTEINLNGPSGLDFIKDLLVRLPEVPVIVFSSSPELWFAERVLRAGGRGYVMKSAAPSVLEEAVRSALAGGVFVSGVVSESILRRMRPGVATVTEPTSVLSDRELEVFLLIGEGVCTAAIARLLRVSVSTVETYRGAIKRKLDLANSSELMRAAVACVFAKNEVRPAGTPLSSREGGSWEAGFAKHAFPDFLQI